MRLESLEWLGGRGITQPLFSCLYVTLSMLEVEFARRLFDSRTLPADDLTKHLLTRLSICLVAVVFLVGVMVPLDVNIDPYLFPACFVSRERKCGAAWER